MPDVSNWLRLQTFGKISKYIKRCCQTILLRCFSWTSCKRRKAEHQSPDTSEDERTALKITRFACRWNSGISLSTDSKSRVNITWHQNYLHTMRLCMSTYVHHGTMSISVDVVSQYLSIIQYPHQPISCSRAHACVQLSKSFAILPKLTTSGASSFRKDVASCQEPGSTVNKGTGINDWNPTRNLKVLLDKKFDWLCFAMFCKRKSVPHSWHSFKLGTKCSISRETF